MLRFILILSCLFIGCDPQQKQIKIPEQKVVINYKDLTVTQMKDGSYEVETKEKVEVLYFGAVWCGPCQQMKRMFKDKDVQAALKKVDFKIIDIDKNPELKRKYKVRVVPTTIIDSKEKRYEGAMSKERFLKILSQVSP